MSNTETVRTIESSRDCAAASFVPVLERIQTHTTDVGGIAVHRALPRKQRRLIGAWCFLDHIGPVRHTPVDLHVGEHPHIGLQTFTWMMEGELLHRDSLGTEKIIRPGQVNLMTAGHGIAHTEDATPGLDVIHAAQLWIALPPEHADIPPAFDHYDTLPNWTEQGVEMTLLIGNYGDKHAPTKLYSPLVGVDIHAKSIAEFELDLREDFEYGLLPLQGSFTIDGETFSENELAYLGCGRRRLTVAHAANSRALLVGGTPVSHEVFIWWNFVSHSRSAIIEAQHQWEAGSERFGKVPKATKRLVAPTIPWDK